MKNKEILKSIIKEQIPLIEEDLRILELVIHELKKDYIGEGWCEARLINKSISGISEKITKIEDLIEKFLLKNEDEKIEF